MDKITAIDELFLPRHCQHAVLMAGGRWLVADVDVGHVHADEIYSVGATITVTTTDCRLARR